MNLNAANGVYRRVWIRKVTREMDELEKKEVNRIPDAVAKYEIKRGYWKVVFRIPVRFAEDIKWDQLWFKDFKGLADWYENLGA